MMLSSISDLWNKWNLRDSVILSFSLQVFLTLFASFRKKTTNHHVHSILWLAYLAADWIAIFAIGLVSHGQCNLPAHVAKVDKAVQAFWTSFLLLHLGGPDNLIVFSLEDKSLWQRHLLNYIFQVSAAISLFVQIFLGDKSLLIPTMMVFLAGGIKFVERTRALYLSSLPKLRQSMMTTVFIPPISDVHNPSAPNLNALSYEYSNEEDAKLAESTVAKDAHFLFRIFKVFIVDLMYTREHRTVSRGYFSRVSAMDALRVISTEFHFFHEMLHTKALAIYSKWSYFFRSIAFTLVTVAFVLFIHSKKDGFSGLDVKITYILLSGGIALDAIALLMLLFSDWTIAKIMPYELRLDQQSSFLGTLLSSFLSRLLSAMIDMKKPRFAKCKVNATTDLTYDVLNTLFIFRRWSETICACNLFSEFLKESPRKMFKHERNQGVVDFFNICIFPFRMATKMASRFREAGATIAGGGGRGAFTYDSSSMIAHTKYVSENPFINKLWIYIFNEVRHKCTNADGLTEVRKIFEARGDLFLESSNEKLGCGHLLDYVAGGNYDFSILTWHVATEIWYNREQPKAKNDERKFSKILSDYIFYLLLNQPNVMSTLAGSAQVTVAEMLFEIWIHTHNVAKDLNKLSEKLYKVPFQADTKSALRAGINLAQEMEGLEEKKWKVMSGVWVEMLSYAATHIKGVAHVQVLSRGGELLAFVWLLMVHFGCFYKHEWGISYERHRLYELGKPTSV